MNQSLSIIINVKNGASTIGKCLASLHKFTDIIVFDNYSTDNTLEVVKNYPNVTIIQHEFCGMGKVRNLAAAHAKNDWVFFVDCDEVLNEDLVDQLLGTDFERGNIYLIKRQNYFANLFINSSSWENDWIKRLFNRNDTKFVENEVHDSFEVNSSIGYKKITTGFMYHFPYATVSQLIDKMQFYSTLYAKQHYNKKFPKLWLIPFRAFFMFIKCYILKRGFMDGFAGFAISSYNAMGVFSKYIKLYELYNNFVLGLVIKVDSTAELDRLARNINNQSLLPEYTYIMIPQELFSSEYNNGVNSVNNLCMQNQIVAYIEGKDWQQQIEKLETQDYLVYIDDNDVLANKNLLKKFKKSVLAGKKQSKFNSI